MLAASVSAQEFRALWVDAFHAGFRTSSEVTKLVADARAGNFNAVIVEVRKRGDAYYNSQFEPKATDVSPPGYDPLADLIAKAHNTTNGARVEVHAWIVTYPIWGSQSSAPSQADHPYRLHPDWLTRNNSGATWNGSQYAFDPGHPAVQQHTFDVAMDIIANYDVDGLNFDYVRYAGNTWGYNEVAVARFNTRFGRSGVPAPTDAAWLQFRRDQVTSLVRKVYLSTLAIKPHVKISADTICFAPGVTTAANWTNSAAAYTSVLQDWRAWMEEGILDMAIPMAYFDQAGQFAYSWTNWNTFAKNHRYNRHVVIGPGIYLNSVSNALFQMRYTRLPSTSGNLADGVCGYSYAVPNKEGVALETFLAALTQTNTARLYDSHPVPLFAERAAPPEMPWKTTPIHGHVKGFVFESITRNGLDGAAVTVTGPVTRTVTSDATGFYGFVDLPPGNYALAAQFSRFETQSTNVTVLAGVVRSSDLTLSVSRPAIAAHPVSRTVAPGENTGFTVTASGFGPLSYQWRFNGAPIAGATSPVLALNNVQLSDAGSYSVVVSNVGGAVESAPATLTVIVLPIHLVSVSPGAKAAVVHWNTDSPMDARVEFGLSTNYANATPYDPRRLTTHTALLSGLVAESRYYFRILSGDDSVVHAAGPFTFDTAGAIVMDNPQATFTGAWTLGTSAPGRYSNDYHFKGTVSGTGSGAATYTPDMLVPGLYDVYVWYPEGGNRTVEAPFVVESLSGSVTSIVNQTTGGGTWQLIAARQRFAPGRNGFVRVSNQTGDPGKVVIADAVRFVYVGEQDFPTDSLAPMWWTRAHFDADIDAHIDHDGDGYPTWTEYVLGTAPRDAGSRLNLALRHSGPGAFEATFAPYHDDRSYELQFRPEPGPAEWRRVFSPIIPGEPGHGTIAISNAIDGQAVFRLKVNWAP